MRDDKKAKRQTLAYARAHYLMSEVLHWPLRVGNPGGRMSVGWLNILGKDCI